jgi:hypothetical protein
MKLYEAIDHVIGCHVVSPSHKDGVELDGIDEGVVKFEDVLSIIYNLDGESSLRELWAGRRIQGGSH